MSYFGRSKNFATNPYNFSDMYDDYIKDKDEKSPYYVSRAQYIDINSKYFAALSKSILNGNCVKLPYMLGYMRVVKYMVNYKYPSKLPIDWITTLKYKKKILNLNVHSKGALFKFKWDKETCRVKNLYYYCFVMSRDNKRELARLIKHGGMDYLENK